MAQPRFGIMTAPMQVAYEDVLRVWREADEVPAIEHAWLFDHLMPIGGDPLGPALDPWRLGNLARPIGIVSSATTSTSWPTHSKRRM